MYSTQVIWNENGKKGGIFDGQQMRQFINDPHFKSSVNEIESITYMHFICSSCKNISRQQNGDKYRQLVEKVSFHFKKLDYNMLKYIIC